jgi:hypothetical protein
MKILRFAVVVFAIISGCTLEKENYFEYGSDIELKFQLDFTLSGIKNTEKYKIIILSDTTNLYNQVPSYTFTGNEISIPTDTLINGFWVMFKRWSQDSIYETEPLFMSYDIPVNSKITNIKLDKSIPVIARKAITELVSIRIDVQKAYDPWTNKFYDWDASDADDSVSLELPDVYFTLDDFFSSGNNRFIDQPYGWLTYEFNHLTLPALKYTVLFTLYDYDFDISSDDYIGYSYLGIYPIEYPVSSKSNVLSCQYTIGSSPYLTIFKY